MSKDIKGFEDLAEESKKQTKKRISNDINCMTFLEVNSKRLELVYDFLTNKLLLASKYPQDFEILGQLEQTQVVLQSQLINYCIRPGSGFEKNISTIWERHFKTN